MAQFRNTRTGDVVSVTGPLEQVYDAKAHWEPVKAAPAVFLGDKTEAELRDYASSIGVDLAGAKNKADVQERIIDARTAGGGGGTEEQKKARDSEGA